MKLVNSLIVAVLALTCGCQTTEDDQMSEVAQTEIAHLGHQPVFTKADLDGDGQLSGDEAATYYHREQLRLYDLDGDSHISKSEWASARPSAAETDQHFNRFDKDGDGKVSEPEAVAYITEHVSFTDAFTKYDENGDFNIHWQEIDAAAPIELNVTLFSIHPQNS